MGEDGSILRWRVGVCGERRSWSPSTKARIVAESSAPGAMINVVARRHGINPSQLSQWRRELAGGSSFDAGGVEPAAFAPVIVEEATARNKTNAQPMPGEIEIARGAWMVRVRGGVDAVALTAVLQVLADLS